MANHSAFPCAKETGVQVLWHRSLITVVYLKFAAHGR